ncbi:hypothetical protein LEA_14042, partial [human gut metagenome]
MVFGECFLSAFEECNLSYDLSDVFRKWSHLNDRNSRLSVYFSGENLATITGYSG